MSQDAMQEMGDDEMAEVVMLLAELRTASRELRATQIDKRAVLQLEAQHTERVNKIQATLDGYFAQARGDAPPGTRWNNP